MKYQIDRYLSINSLRGDYNIYNLTNAHSQIHTHKHTHIYTHTQTLTLKLNKLICLEFNGARFKAAIISLSIVKYAVIATI